MKFHYQYLKVVILLFFVCLPVLSYGVTDKEMEQARTIAAKSYLRYANDGSGYLDDLNPATMEELESSLKNKEKENIKAFKAIPVPSDYKEWDKDKLVEYWAVIAFQNKGLLEKGRGGRVRARNQINKMEITSPQKAEVTPAVPVQENNAIQNSDSLAGNPATELETLKAQEQNVLNQEESMEEDPEIDRASNYTWVYIMVLAILVGIVIALVVYAGNVMKRNAARGAQSVNPKNNAFMPKDTEAMERLETAVADRDMEISMLKKKLETSARQNSELRSKIEDLTAEIASLKAAAQSIASSRFMPRNEEEKEAQSISKTNLRTIYLGRANSKGIFIRADRNLNPGNSIFVLDTADGFSGTFRVAASQEVWDLALSNPKEYLETACMGRDLDDPGPAKRIVNESAGTAVFEGGCWRVIRKARIRYEM